MSEHSEFSPSRGRRSRLNEDTLSSLPRKSFQVTMTGGIIHQESCATLMTEPNSDEDSRSNKHNMIEEMSGVNNSPPRQMRISKAQEAESRSPKLWKDYDEEGAVMEPESECEQSPLNLSVDSTLDTSVDNDGEEAFGEVASDATKESEEEKKFWFHNKKCLFLLILFGFMVLVAISVPTAVVVISKEAEVVTMAPSVSISPSLSPSTSVMPSDLPSMVPTDTQVPSDLPSALPSNVPSITPTDTYKPSDKPSSNPSLSLVPSMVPTDSMVPSSQPSVSPTDTYSPSAAPTKLPSSSPSLSMEPTFTPIDPNWRFKLRLYWSPSYFWQEEKEEKYWCLECVPCAEYGRDDGWKHGCNGYPNGLNHHCKVGDSVWIRDCRWYGNEYNVLQRHKHGFTLRLHNTDLCVERRNKHLMMKRCNIEDPDQQFVPWTNFNKFELRPLVMDGWTEREADCVSQLHHPKSEEVVGMHNCRLCRHFETRYWEIYK